MLGLEENGGRLNAVVKIVEFQVRPGQAVGALFCGCDPRSAPESLTIIRKCLLLAPTLPVQRSGVSSYRAGRQNASSLKKSGKAGGPASRLAHTLLTPFQGVGVGAWI